MIELKHARLIRWSHWINFPLLFVMTWSGLMIYWANDVYRVGWGELTLFHFFPDWFFEKLGLHHRLADGMALHFSFMWLFAVNGLAYGVYAALFGEWRFLLPGKGALRDAWRVLLHDLHLSKRVPPQRKFNAAQQLAYTGIVLVGAGSILTGLSIYKPTQIGWLTAALGGYEWARWEHFWLTIGYCAFFVIHVAQVIRAGWNNFRGMVSGYELISKGGPDGSR